MYMAILLAVSMIPILILSVVAITSLRSQLLSEVDATTRSLNQAIVSETQRFVVNATEQLSVYVGLLDHGYDHSFIQTTLEIAARAHHEIDRLLILDEEAALLSDTSQDKRLAGTDYSGLAFIYAPSSDAGGTRFSSATLSPFSGSVTVFIGRRTGRGGMVVFELNLDNFSHYLAPLRIGPTDRISIVDKTGRFIAHTEPNYVQEQRFETRLDSSSPRKVVIRESGRTWFAYHQSIPETPWRVVYYRDANQALSAVPFIIGIFLILGLLSIAAAVSIAFNMRRLSRLVFADYSSRTEAVAAGHYELRVGSPYIEFDGLSRSISAMAEAVSRREDELRSAVAEREHLLREIHHRVKNNLQIVASLLNLELGTLSDPEQAAALNSSMERIRSMGLVHETLYGQSRLDEVNLGDYARNLLDYLAVSYLRPGLAIERNLSDCRLSLEQALPCGLILNELLTNAFKYGTGDRSEAKLIVNLTEDQAFLILSVGDDGPGFRSDFDPLTSSSLGVSLVRSLTEQLGGAVAWKRLETGGTLATVRFPRSRR